MGSNLHFFRYATTTGSAGECPHCGGPDDHGDDCRHDHHGAFLELIGAARKTGVAVPFNRAHGLGLSYRRDRDLAPERVDDDSRFYTWIWLELVDRGLLELVARLAVR